MIPRTRALRFGCAAVLSALVVSLGPTGVGAIGGGAGATGEGDEIISSILASGGRRAGVGGVSGRPTCRTHVLSDRQVVFLLHVAATMPELLDASFLRALEDYSNSTVVAGAADGDLAVSWWDLTVRICDGVADTMSVLPRTTDAADVGAAVLAGGLLRRRTRLPPPRLVVTPPPRAATTGVELSTVVGEPVFFSTPGTPAVRQSITHAGRTVEVEAVPHHLELFSGQPGSADRVEVCEGLGIPWDPGSAASVRAQARDPRTCVLHFERATGGASRPTWTGYAALDWEGRYRVDGGAWNPLDGLFSTAVFDISVGEVDTVIESP